MRRLMISDQIVPKLHFIASTLHSCRQQMVFAQAAGDAHAGNKLHLHRQQAIFAQPASRIYRCRIQATFVQAARRIRAGSKKHVLHWNARASCTRQAAFA